MFIVLLWFRAHVGTEDWAIVLEERGLGFGCRQGREDPRMEQGEGTNRAEVRTLRVLVLCGVRKRRDGTPQRSGIRRGADSAVIGGGSLDQNDECLQVASFV